MSMSNETDPWHTPGACQPIIFRVELFGGRLHDTDPPDSMASYADSSNQAHLILGVLVLVMVLGWSAFVLEQIKIKHAYYISGITQMIMGIYLMSWVFIWMFPSNIPELIKYSTHDLLQLQHIAIASLLFAAGWMELLHGATGMLEANEWHLAWGMNAAMTGMVFIAHPQHTFYATIKHMLLGIALTLASILFGRAKQSNFTNERAKHDVDWAMVCAGLLYSMAAVILIIFRETPRPVHLGTSITCQGSWYLTCSGYVIAGLTIFISVIAVCCNWCSQIQEIRKLQYDHSYELTHIDINRRRDSESDMDLDTSPIITDLSEHETLNDISHTHMQ